VNTDIARNEITAKMKQRGMHPAAIGAFLSAVEKVAGGDAGMWPENEIDAIEAVPTFDSLPRGGGFDPALLRQLAVIKLNGGLGTSMGLDRAKSLLPVKGDQTFLDFIVRQILLLREKTGGTAPDFYFMNSPHTREDTLAYLQKYPKLTQGRTIDFLQNAVPKLDPQTLRPVEWAADPELEWCPPGHGDIYPSLIGTGLLEQMLKNGVRYLFVSNSDNLGATVDPAVLSYFASSGLSFMMEVAERTGADRKGGHLARRKSDGRLLLRESAQCPKADEAAFQDIGRHRFFNTNNLWIQLEDLRDALQKNGGVLPLPLIKNAKTVDPTNLSSPKVLQLETAMGAAIQLFEKSGALMAPRTRFAPVKTTSDLLVLRSDACIVTEDARLVLDPSRKGQPPLVDLDGEYKLLAGFEKRFANGAPSLIKCDALKVSGKLTFSAGVVCQGKVELANSGPDEKTVAAGTYGDGRHGF
jgi:UDP-N-acetylglucosamine pyrophosphorylase